MSILIQPYLKDRPICAAIRVDRNSVQDSKPTTRIFSRVVRNSAGDLWTLKYSLGLPVGVTLIDSHRRVHVVYHPGAQTPTVTPDRLDPTDRPAHFPQEPPDETPVVLSGISCFFRRWTSYPTTTELWYSYEYAAQVRTILKSEGYGTTIWYLDEVKLDEPPSELFDEASIRASEPEYEQNLGKVLAEVFQRMSKNAPLP